MRTTTLLSSLASLAVAAALAGPASAQRLASFMAGGPGFVEHQPPTLELPAALPPLVGYPQLPPMAALPFPAGDSGFNNVTGLHWVTNGALVATQPTPTFPALGPVIPPAPIPPPVLAAIGGGPVTGLAVNPAAGIVWLAGAGGLVVGVGAVPAMPIVVPAFLVIGLVPPLTGLEFDAVTGTLWAVNAAGVAFPFFPGGAPAGPIVPPPFVLPAPAQDIAIDKTLRLNPAGARPLFVIAGPIIVDIADPAPLPFPSPMPASQGLAFVDHPAAVPPVGFCACPGLAGPANFTSGPMASGNLGWSIGMTGLAPFGIGIFAFDVVFNPAFPLFNVVGCNLGLIPGSPTLVLGLALADAAGNAVFPLPLGVPPGVGPLYNQNLTFCPADPTGFVFTPMQTIYSCGL